MVNFSVFSGTFLPAHSSPFFGVLRKFTESWSSLNGALLIKSDACYGELGVSASLYAKIESS